jgi:hypothetical protein
MRSDVADGLKGKMKLNSWLKPHQGSLQQALRKATSADLHHF